MSLGRHSSRESDATPQAWLTIQILVSSMMRVWIGPGYKILILSTSAPHQIECDVIPKTVVTTSSSTVGGGKTSSTSGEEYQPAVGK
ncbi:hypothetical protein AWC38_SpisGene3746 [Stylophora pistillata]|uniref:Uncharacterized protein n=1 Tax=Stylophora pistillata TaxID=50429 RepID=A0A2B4SQV7_STYPI|nr:hypothetical protein AWC38_SpisGene3746 [Stylophora pistillata]